MKLSKLTERMITAGLVALLVGIFIYQVAYGYSSNIAFSKGHTSAYIAGYKGGLNNDTIDTACGINASTDQYGRCTSGYYAGKSEQRQQHIKRPCFV